MYPYCWLRGRLLARAGQVLSRAELHEDLSEIQHRILYGELCLKGMRLGRLPNSSMARSWAASDRIVEVFPVLRFLARNIKMRGILSCAKTKPFRITLSDVRLKVEPDLTQVGKVFPV